MITPLNIALSQYGIKEIRGGENPEILKYFHAIGHEWVVEDETAWCAAFVNWCNLQAGKEYSGELDARSFESVGRRIQVPLQGDLVILWREDPSSWKGHVGYFIRQDKENIWILGGNQSDQVMISPYPRHRLLQYRRV